MCLWFYISHVAAIDVLQHRVWKLWKCSPKTRRPRFHFSSFKGKSLLFSLFQCLSAYLPVCAPICLFVLFSYIWWEGLVLIPKFPIWKYHCRSCLDHKKSFLWKKNLQVCWVVFMLKQTPYQISKLNLKAPSSASATPASKGLIWKTFSVVACIKLLENWKVRMGICDWQTG